MPSSTDIYQIKVTLRHSKPPKDNRLPERLGEALAVLALADDVPGGSIGFR